MIALETWINASIESRPEQVKSLEWIQSALDMLIPNDLCLHIDPCEGYIEVDR
jgi:hypothetical protein